MDDIKPRTRRRLTRRTFLGTGLAIGAGAAGVGLLPAITARATGMLAQGDAAILRFLAALEILETDFWQQYNELVAFRTAKFWVEAEISHTPRRWHSWTLTWRSTSMTTLKTSSLTSTSSTCGVQQLRPPISGCP